MPTRPATEVAVLPVSDLIDRGADVNDHGLIGSACESCGARAFPRRFVCLVCASTELVDVTLPSRGSLYSFTTVHVSSSRPTPYTLGYVDLEGGARLLAALPSDVPLEPDMPVELAITADGSWSFVPQAVAA